MPVTQLVVVDQIKAGKPQSVAVSQTNQVVSEVFSINAEDSLSFSFLVKTSAVGGTGGIVKLQHSIENVAASFADVDATNAKVTLSSQTNFPLILNATATNFLAKMPLFKFLRFVCTTGGSDTCTLSSILVQLHA